MRENRAPPSPGARPGPWAAGGVTRRRTPWAPRPYLRSSRVGFRPPAPLPAGTGASVFLWTWNCLARLRGVSLHGGTSAATFTAGPPRVFLQIPTRAEASPGQGDPTSPGAEPGQPSGRGRVLLSSGALGRPQPASVEGPPGPGWGVSASWMLPNLAALAARSRPGCWGNAQMPRQPRLSTVMRAGGGR